MTRGLALGSALLAFGLFGASGGAAAPAQSTQLFATVGPDFTINLRDASGARLTRLDPGTYEIQVRDLSNEHNFRLRGPGVDRATEVEETGTANWAVTLTDGTYLYQCDPHAPMMNGSLAVGNAPAPQPPPAGGGGGGGGGGTAVKKLVLTSGPSQVITLRTPAGRAVKTVERGTYTVTVRDRSRIHNAHLSAPGYNRATTVGFSGTRTWRVRLARTGTLRFLCDPHGRVGMRGSARITR